MLVRCLSRCCGVLVVVCLVSPVAAGIDNGNFSDGAFGLDHWNYSTVGSSSGVIGEFNAYADGDPEVSGYDFGEDSDPFGAGTYAGKAYLSNPFMSKTYYPGFDHQDFDTYISQVFVFEEGENSIAFSYKMTTNLPSETDDFSVSLFDNDLGKVVFYENIISSDEISCPGSKSGDYLILAGESEGHSLTLTFNLMNHYDVTDDGLTQDSNVEINTVTTGYIPTVPVPGALALAGFGLALVSRSRLRKR